jgi:hypothetical protein
MPAGDGYLVVWVREEIVEGVKHDDRAVRQECLKRFRAKRAYASAPAGSPPQPARSLPQDDPSGSNLTLGALV